MQLTFLWKSSLSGQKQQCYFQQALLLGACVWILISLVSSWWQFSTEHLLLRQLLWILVFFCVANTYWYQLLQFMKLWFDDYFTSASSAKWGVFGVPIVPFLWNDGGTGQFWNKNLLWDCDPCCLAVSKHGIYPLLALDTGHAAEATSHWKRLRVKCQVIYGSFDMCLNAWCVSLTIRSSDNDTTGFWPPGSLHALGADGHI